MTSRIVKAVCEACGEKFTHPHWQKRRFCSKPCFWKLARDRAIEDRQCEYCNKKFHPRWDTQRFCSRRCGYDNRRKPRVTENCVQCGKLLRRDRPKHVRYCSPRCVQLGSFGRIRGPVAPLGTIKNTQSGYLAIKVGKEYPGSNRTGWILHHRYLMEQHLDRHLERREHIHHKNGRRDDNRLENLELWALDHANPAGVRPYDKILDDITKLSNEDRERLLQALLEMQGIQA